MRTSNMSVIFLFGEIDYPKIEAVFMGITEHFNTKPKTPVKLVVSSRGGSVSAGFALVDMLMFLQKKGLILHSIGTGAVGSMAVPIFMSAERRSITPHTHFFFHEVGFGTDSRITTSEARLRAMNLQREQEWGVDFITQRSGKVKATYIHRLMTRTTYLYPNDILKLGLAHGILET